MRGEHDGVEVLLQLRRVVRRRRLGADGLGREDLSFWTDKKSNLISFPNSVAVDGGAILQPCQSSHKSKMYEELEVAMG